MDGTELHPGGFSANCANILLGFRVKAPRLARGHTSQTGVNLFAQFAKFLLWRPAGPLASPGADPRAPCWRVAVVTLSPRQPADGCQSGNPDAKHPSTTEQRSPASAGSSPSPTGAVSRRRCRGPGAASLHNLHGLYIGKAGPADDTPRDLVTKLRCRHAGRRGRA
jgi:hypothetical protein